MATEPKFGIPAGKAVEQPRISDVLHCLVEPNEPTILYLIDDISLLDKLCVRENKGKVDNVLAVKFDRLRRKNELAVVNAKEKWAHWKRKRFLLGWGLKV